MQFLGYSAMIWIKKDKACPILPATNIRGPHPALPHHSTMSLLGTSVWTGRALQAGFDDLEIIGLAHLYSAL
jgi:hypothetical protein